MASRSKIPAEHREYAAPDDILPKLTQAEADRRAEAVHLLHDSADGIGEREIRSATKAHAERMRRAMPFREYQAEVARRKGAMENLPGTGDAAFELHAGHRAALKKLEEQNPYPDDIDRVLRTAEWLAAEGRVSKGGISKAALKAEIKQMVAKEMQAADVARRTAQLRKDIADFRASIEKVSR